jgi:hypothetical protein
MLDLSYNCITALPKEIGQLAHLVRFAVFDKLKETHPAEF